MSEGSRFWTTNNTGDGPTAGYSAANFQQFVRETFMTNPAAEGVLYGVGNALAVSGTSSPVAVNTGAALVYGFYYYNDASLNVAVATPAASTRIDRIVLRVSWAAQTVRVTRIAGVEGAGVAPAMTQTANTTWDIPLATVSITTGGVITVTDARTYLKHPGVYGWLNAALTVNDDLTVTKSESGGYVDIKAYNTSNTAGSEARLIATVAGASAGDAMVVLENSGVTAWALGMDNSDSDKFKISVGATPGTNDRLTLDSSGNLTADGSATADAFLIDANAYFGFSSSNPIINLDANDYLQYDRTANTFNLYIGGVLVLSMSASALSVASLNASQLTSGTVPAARITAVTADSIDDTMVGNRVPALTRRQGGSATDWDTAGTTTYTPGAVRMQSGTIAVTFSGSAVASQAVTFPVAFSAKPGVVCGIVGNPGSAIIYTPQAQSVAAAGFTVYLAANGSISATVNIFWLAVGTE
jgi:hypothetical protein